MPGQPSPINLPSLAGDIQFWVSGGLITGLVALWGMRNSANSQLVTVLNRNDALSKENGELRSELAEAAGRARDYERILAECARLTIDRDNMRQWAEQERERADEAARIVSVAREEAEHQKELEAAALRSDKFKLEEQVADLKRQLQQFGEIKHEVDVIHSSDPTEAKPRRTRKPRTPQ